MAQKDDDPSGLDVESSRGAGSVCYKALYFFLKRKRPGYETHPGLLLQRKKKTFREVLHEGWTDLTRLRTTTINIAITL